MATWVIEDLTGTKDAVNKTFGFTNTPDFVSAKIIFNGAILKRVFSLPSGLQYQVDTTAETVDLAIAPASTDKLWSRYRTED